MSVRRPDFRPSDEEPAVIHPTLRAMVDAARRQPAPQIELDEETLHEQWLLHRARRRNALGLGLGFAAAASLAMLLVRPGSVDEPVESRGVGPAVAEVASAARKDPRERSTGLGSKPEADPSSEVIAGDALAAAEPTPTLASTIEVLALEESGAAPKVLGPRHLELPDGRWSLRNPDDSAVTVTAGDQVLELRGGQIHVEVAGDVARVEVRSGEVVRFDAEGRSLATPSVDPKSTPSADVLAREAEAHLLAGRRRQAIKSLRRLVSSHPRSSATPAALIDLGRLLERVGRHDEARCAYATFMVRWPQHNLLGDVRRAHDALGDGLDCRGLRPRR